MKDAPQNPYEPPNSTGVAPRSYPYHRIAYWAFVCAVAALGITVLVTLASALFLPDSIAQERTISDTIGACAYSLIFFGMIATIIAFVCGNILVKLACLPIGAINVQMVYWGWQEIQRLIWGAP